MTGSMGEPRVVGIVPIVSAPNLIPQVNEMWQSYGTWSYALNVRLLYQWLSHRRGSIDFLIHTLATNTRIMWRSLCRTLFRWACWDS